MALHRFAKGLDVPLAGAPAQAIEPAARASRVALVAADYPGLKPTLLVQPGDRVLRGTGLVDDKQTGVRYTSPAAGIVAAVHRGERRALQSVVIDVASDDGPAAQVEFACTASRPRGDAPDADAVRAALLETGLWSALRARPFSKVPAPTATPYALFVTAMDTRPHAASPDVVLAQRRDDFHAGVAALSKLVAGKTYVCKAAGSTITAPSLPNVVVEEFAGPHPAGTVGLHIHTLAPVDLARSVWHVGYQDVAAIGAFLRTGQLDVERVVALGGPPVARPRLLRTRTGASLDEIVRGEIAGESVRVISGSVLDGRAASGEVHGFLGRYHQQIAVLAEARTRELFGWLAPTARKYSIWGVVAGHWRRNGGLPLDTSTNGSPRAMVPIGGYERVMPMDLMPTFLLRALITGDAERAEALGVLELDEEDLALCTFVCPGKYEYGPLLRATLARIEKEG